MNVDETTPAGFAELGLSPSLLASLEAARITLPTPIQAKAIPTALGGADLIGIAQTGTGKTLAFALPILYRLQETMGRALILVPTRELAIQVDQVIAGVAARIRPSIRTSVIIGGASMNAQRMALRSNPRVIIATPGRLIDHMEQRTIDLSTVTTLVLDEADRMFDMGFIRPITRIIEATPQKRQTMLFSATMSPEVVRLSAAHMIAPVTIEAAPPGTTASLVEQQICYVDKNRKPEMLAKLLGRYEGRALVFSRTKHGATKLTRVLAMSGFSAAEIHANRSLGQRRQALEGFQSGRYRVLVATDVAARGIDVKDIQLVVNYDLPDAPADYVHRIGRTARAGKSGVAVSLADHDQYNDVRTIERLVRADLPLSEFSEEKQQRATFSGSSGGRDAQRNRPRTGFRPSPQRSNSGGQARDDRRWRGHDEERRAPREGNWPAGLSASR